VHNKVKGEIPIKMISLEDKTVNNFKVHVQGNRKIQMIEQISPNHLLVKKDRQMLQLFDVERKTMVVLNCITLYRFGFFCTPCANLLIKIR
jgi:hypothetical protein